MTLFVDTVYIVKKGDGGVTKFHCSRSYLNTFTKIASLMGEEKETSNHNFISNVIVMEIQIIFRVTTEQTKITRVNTLFDGAKTITLDPNYIIMTDKTKFHFFFPKTH